MQIDGVAVVQPDDSAASPTHPLKSRALSAKLKAYIALLEKASMKDLHGLLLKEPKLEDDFSPVTSPTMSPERNTPRQGTEAGTVYTMIGTGRCDIDVHTETPDQVLSAETRLPSAELLLVAKGEKRKRSRNRSQLRAFDDPVWYAVSGQTLIASAGASGQLAAKHAAEELVAQGDVVTEIAGSPKKVDMRRQVCQPCPFLSTEPNLTWPQVHIALPHRDAPLACTVGLTNGERPDPRTPVWPYRSNREDLVTTVLPIPKHGHTHTNTQRHGSISFPHPHLFPPAGRSGPRGGALYA